MLYMGHTKIILFGYNIAVFSREFAEKIILLILGKFFIDILW